MLQFTLGFLLAILTFHINHKIKRVVDIKILINSLFDIYGNLHAFKEHNNKDVNIQLMGEILNVEKMYDNNPYIKKQVEKLKALRMLYFNDTEDISKELGKINFKRLGRSFLIVSVLNLNPEELITMIKK